jgi:hypothetical protein
MQKFILKYGIRFGPALLVCVVIQSLQSGAWNWYDFAGRSITTFAIVWLSYPLESWVRKAANKTNT